MTVLGKEMVGKRLGKVSCDTRGGRSRFFWGSFKICDRRLLALAGPRPHPPAGALKFGKQDKGWCDGIKAPFHPHSWESPPLCRCAQIAPTARTLETSGFIIMTHHFDPFLAN